ncbi:phosphatase PAP2 family protein [Rhizobium sp. CG5]|uniref:phosphatase PAP2 family protein n=1 Tax=Rhizobium sp. CG5 TaxID=2726076 RepID=UPI0020338DA9|nr:phosphatase PAP2 family protein [Rhizobium sp. CG5]
MNLTLRLFSLAVFSMLILDRPLALAVSDLPHWFRTAASWISGLAAPVVILPFLFGLWLSGVLFGGASAPRRPAFGLFSLCCSLAAVASSLLVKNIVGRARPDSTHDWDRLLLRPFAFDDAFASIPSTQGAFAAAVTCSAAICFPQHRICLLTVGALVCASRVVVGEHWTSDVIAGWAMGWLLTLAMLRLFRTSSEHQDG